MKYLLKWKNEKGTEMYEVYDNEELHRAHHNDGKETYTIEEHAKVMLDFFNATVRPGESKRFVVSISTNLVIPDEPYQSILKGDGKRRLLYGFLNPNGHFHKCGYADHRWWAEDYIEKHNIELVRSESNPYGDEEQHLMELGWIKFGRSSFGVHVFTYSKITKANIKWIEEHISEIDEDQIKKFNELLEIYNDRGIN